MAGFLGDAYLWVKALHILAVIAWMAGFLYLPRLFVYHCQAAPGSPQSETFKVMERRLLRAIMNPAMLVARSEEHTSELQSLMRISYAVFCLKKKKTNTKK